MLRFIIGSIFATNKLHAMVKLHATNKLHATINFHAMNKLNAMVNLLLLFCVG